MYGKLYILRNTLIRTFYLLHTSHGTRTQSPARIHNVEYNSEVNVSMEPPQIDHKTCRIQVSHSSTPWVTRGWQHTPNHQSRRPAVNGSPSKHCVLCFNTTLLPRCDQAWELHCPLRPSSKSVISLHSPAKEPK